jgi:tetratricopeptide (TPR) repeat protein
MRTLNRKLFLGLVLGTFVAAAVLFGVHLFQYQRIAKALLWQAGRAEEQGQVERVARYLQRYLEFAPRDLDARANLGRTLASDYYAGDPRTRQKAVNLLDSVLTADPNRPELRRVLVKTALEVNNLKAAEDNLKVLAVEAGLTGDKMPARERGELEAMAGRLHEAKGETAQAIEKYRAAVVLAPEEQTSYVRLAYLLRRQPADSAAERVKQLAEADQLIQDLVAKNSTDYKPYLARWRYKRDFDLLKTRGTVDPEKVKAAAEDVAAARTRAPDEVEVLLAAADLERLRDNPAEARRLLERGLERENKRVTQGTVDLARFQLLWHLTNLLLDGKKVGDGAAAVRKFDEADRPEVERLIDQVRRTNASPASADYLEGRLRMAQGNWREAVVCLERARPLLTSPPELANQIDLQLGRCYEQLDETALMRDAFDRVTARDGGAISARLGKARALAAQDRVADAIREYEQVLALEGAPDSAWFDLARLRIRQQLESGQTPDWTGANQALDRVEGAALKARDVKRQVEVILLRAELLAFPDRWDRAAAYLKTAREKHPDEVDLWTAYAVILGKRKDGVAEALAVLQDAEKRLKDRVELRLARARLLAEKDYAESKNALADLEKGVNVFPEDDQARLLVGLAEVHSRAGNVAAARRLWEAVTRLPKYRDDLRAYLLLFDLAQKENAEEAMRSALEKIRTVARGQEIYPDYGQALYLIWQARQGKKDQRQALQEARAGLDRVEAVRRSWSAVSLARAEIARLEGNVEQVVVHTRNAIEQGDKNPGTIGQLVEALFELKRFDEANQEMKRLRESLFVDSDLGRLATNVALRNGEVDRALRLASVAVPESTREFRKLLWRAVVLNGANKPEEAEANLRRAVEQAPTEPAPYVALVQFLASRSKGSLAALVIKEATARLPAERLPLALAQCYEALGHLDKAREAYKEAVQTRPGDVAVMRAAASFALRDGRLADALPLLRPIAEGKVKTEAADVEWARHGLAVVLAAVNDYRALGEALELVGVKLDKEGKLLGDPAADRDETSERLRARARVLATQPQPQFRDRAIALFDELSRRRALTPDDQFVLAQLYEAAGNPSAARSQLTDLVGKQPKSPPYVARLAQVLIRPPFTDLDEAERWVKHLETLEKENDVESGAYSSVELRARLLEARQEGDKAVALLRDYANRRNAPPMRKLLVIASLGRQGRFAEALPFCEEAWRTCPPEAVGGTCVALLRGLKKPTDAQARQVAEWLDAAMAKNPRSMALLMHKADLLDLRGDYVGAEALYRRVLQVEPGNVVALNNLAWLLAQGKKSGQAALPLIDAAVNGLGRRPDLLDTRGLVHLALGQTDAALADFREAAGDGGAADPAAATRLFHLARALQESKDSEGAARVLRQARAKGLQAANLHPIEQETCRKLLAELNVN